MQNNADESLQLIPSNLVFFFVFFFAFSVVFVPQTTNILTSQMTASMQGLLRNISSTSSLVIMSGQRDNKRAQAGDA